MGGWVGGWVGRKRDLPPSRMTVKAGIFSRSSGEMYMA